MACWGFPNVEIGGTEKEGGGEGGKRRRGLGLLSCLKCYISRSRPIRDKIKRMKASNEGKGRKEKRKEKKGFIFFNHFVKASRTTSLADIERPCMEEKGRRGENRGGKRKTSSVHLIPHLVIRTMGFPDAVSFDERWSRYGLYTGT